MKRDVVVINMDYGFDPRPMGPVRPPVFRNFHFRNITAEAAPVAILMTGVEQSPIQDVHFSGLNIQSEKGVVAKYIKDCTFAHMEIRPAQGPVYDLTEASAVTVQAGSAIPGREPFLKVAGRGTAGIVVEYGGSAGSTPTCQLGDGVPKEAVTVRPISSDGKPPG